MWTRLREAYQVVTGKELLQKRCLRLPLCLYEELIVARDVEERPTGPRVGQLSEWLVTQAQLGGEGRGEEGRVKSLWYFISNAT